MAKFNQTYPTGLKYTEWQLIMEFFPSYRRLARDYEHTIPSSESMVYLASVRHMLKMVAT
jgi:transposase